MAFRPLNAKNELLLCSIIIYEDKIVAPWGEILLDKSIKNCWVKFRIAIDVENEVARLWMNEKRIGEGRIKVIKKSCPSCFFGGGSGVVSGQVDLEYFKSIAN